MGKMPPRPTARRVTELVAEITKRRHDADDPHRDQLGGNLLDVLAYLRKHPAESHTDAAADRLASLELLAELRWRITEHELSALVRLDALPEPDRPRNRTVAALLGDRLVPQSVRDRRDRHRALLELSERNQHLIREQRRAERDRETGIAQAPAQFVTVTVSAERTESSVGAPTHAPNNKDPQP